MDAQSAVIYGLCEPMTGEVRYVGKTSKGVRARLRTHLRDAKKGGTAVRDWIASLTLPPEVITIDTNPAIGLNASERMWIARLRERGCRLVNMTDGGEGVSNSTSRAGRPRGSRNANPVSLETRRRMSEAKSGRRNPAYNRPAWNKGKRLRADDPARANMRAARQNYLKAHGSA